MMSSSSVREMAQKQEQQQRQKRYFILFNHIFQGQMSGSSHYLTSRVRQVKNRPSEAVNGWEAIEMLLSYSTLVEKVFF